MIEIEGKHFIIDMDKLMAWVVETPTAEKNFNTMTTMTYGINDEDEDVVEKEVTENKSTLNETLNNIRYDFVRNMLNTLFATFTNEYNQMTTINLKDLSFGQKLAFNTLLYKKIIIEINEENNEQR